MIGCGNPKSDGAWVCGRNSARACLARQNETLRACTTQDVTTLGFVAQYCPSSKVMAKHRANPSTGLLGLPTHQSKKFRSTTRKPRGFLAKTLINSTILYALYWILYACPAGVPSADAPEVFHRYYNLKHLVATKAVPHLQPYYEQYAGPYIAKGKPYYDQANVIYGQYAKPVVDKSSSIYSSHVHPVAARSTKAVQTQYRARLGPIVEKYVAEVTNAFEQHIGKHLRTVSSKYDAVVAPYIALVRKQATGLYNEVAMPIYRKTSPYMQAALNRGKALYLTHGHPRVLDMISWAGAFLDTKIMPTIRRFYYIHVEPQVNKITDRFFQFNVSTGFATLNKTSPGAVELAISEAILSSASLTAALESTVIAGETHTVEASVPTVDAKTQARIQHGVIDDLLSIAENNIAKEGSGAEAALRDKLDEILPALVRKEEILCEDYLKQLEKITLEEVDSVEQRIISFAKAQSNKGKSSDEIIDELRPYLIKAGKNIHAQAVEVKAHLSTVLDTLQGKVHKATYVVYDQVLAEGQRQKRVPEQKLRYEMEGVTKKELRRLEALDGRVKDIEEKLNLVSARILKEYTKTLGNLLKDTEKNVESLAGGAANKLHTLRNIGPKKITVLDDSDEFGHGYLPVGLMLGAQAIYNQISTGVYGAPEPTPELPEQVLNSIRSFAADIPNKIDTDTIAAAASYAASVASAQGVNAASAVSSAIAGVDTEAIASSASSAASVASAQAASAYAAASRAAEKIDPDALHASVSHAQEYVGAQAADIAAGASAAVLGTPPAFTASIASKASEAIFGTEAAATASIKSRAHGVFEAASNKFEHLVHGTPVPITESIASRASEAIYGTEVPAAESVLNRVSDAYVDLKGKAAEFIQGSEEEISSASKSAASASSSLASAASRSSYSLSLSASSASSVASRSAVSASAVASRSSESLRRSASSAASVASRSASSASVLASKSLASAARSAKSAVGEETPVVRSVVDKAWEDYASARDVVEDVIENIRERVEL